MHDAAWIEAQRLEIEEQKNHTIVSFRLSRTQEKLLKDMSTAQMRVILSAHVLRSRPATDG